MNILPIKTRILQPPKDDFSDVLLKLIPKLKEKDVVVVTSKIVSIHQGRCVLALRGEAKDSFVREEADACVMPENSFFPALTVKEATILASAGIDTCNGDGYSILLPDDPYFAAQNIQAFIKEHSGLENLGVVIVDSHCVPLRYGTLGISIGVFGIKPIRDGGKTQDLFGSFLVPLSINIADAIASSAVLIMGETNEQTPIAIVRGAPVEFVEQNLRSSLVVPPSEDWYYPVMPDFFNQTIKEGKDEQFAKED